MLNWINDKRMYFYLGYTVISVNLKWFSMIRN